MLTKRTLNKNRQEEILASRLATAQQIWLLYAGYVDSSINHLASTDNPIIDCYRCECLFALWLLWGHADSPSPVMFLDQDRLDVLSKETEKAVNFREAISSKKHAEN